MLNMSFLALKQLKYPSTGRTCFSSRSWAFLSKVACKVQKQRQPNWKNTVQKQRQQNWSKAVQKQRQHAEG